MTNTSHNNLTEHLGAAGWGIGEFVSETKSVCSCNGRPLIELRYLPLVSTPLCIVNGSHLIMHRTIGLTGTIGPLTLTLVH